MSVPKGEGLGYKGPEKVNPMENSQNQRETLLAKAASKKAKKGRQAASGSQAGALMGEEFVDKWTTIPSTKKMNGKSIELTDDEKREKLEKAVAVLNDALQSIKGAGISISVSPLDKRRYLALMIKESSLNPDSVSVTGAKGYFQIKKTAGVEKDVEKKYGSNLVAIAKKLEKEGRLYQRNCVYGLLYFNLLRTGYVDGPTYASVTDDIGKQKLTCMMYNGGPTIMKILWQISKANSYNEFEAFLKNELRGQLAVNKGNKEAEFKINKHSFKVGGRDKNLRLRKVEEILNYAIFIPEYMKGNLSRIGGEVADDLTKDAPVKVEKQSESEVASVKETKELKKIVEEIEIGKDYTNLFQFCVDFRSQDADIIKTPWLKICEVVKQFNSDKGRDLDSKGFPDLGPGVKVLVPTLNYARKKLGFAVKEEGGELKGLKIKPAVKKDFIETKGPVEVQQPKANLWAEDVPTSPNSGVVYGPETLEMSLAHAAKEAGVYAIKLVEKATYDMNDVYKYFDSNVMVAFKKLDDKSKEYLKAKQIPIYLDPEGVIDHLRYVSSSVVSVDYDESPEEILKDLKGQVDSLMKKSSLETGKKDAEVLHESEESFVLSNYPLYVEDPEFKKEKEGIKGLSGLGFRNDLEKQDYRVFAASMDKLPVGGGVTLKGKAVGVVLNMQKQGMKKNEHNEVVQDNLGVSTGDSESQSAIDQTKPLNEGEDEAEFEFSAVHKYDRKTERPDRDETKYIILHSTGANGEGDVKKKTRATYFVSAQGEITYIVNHKKEVGHCGSVANIGAPKMAAMWNGDGLIDVHSIGIEVEAMAGETWNDNQYTAIRNLLRWLGSKYPAVKMKDVLTHGQVACDVGMKSRGRKQDPYYVDWSRLGLPFNYALTDMEVASGILLDNENDLMKPDALGRWHLGNEERKKMAMDAKIVNSESEMDAYSLIKAFKPEELFVMVEVEKLVKGKKGKKVKVKVSEKRVMTAPQKFEYCKEQVLKKISRMSSGVGDAATGMKLDRYNEIGSKLDVLENKVVGDRKDAFMTGLRYSTILNTQKGPLMKEWVNEQVKAGNMRIVRYVVQSGDGFAAIAARKEYDTNRNLISMYNDMRNLGGKDVGKTILIPVYLGRKGWIEEHYLVDSKRNTYTIKKKDNLAAIADKYGTDQGSIILYNKLFKFAGKKVVLTAGSKIVIPVPRNK